MCSCGKLWSKSHKKTKQPNCYFSKSWEQKQGVRSKSRLVSMPPQGESKGSGYLFLLPLMQQGPQ